MELDRVSCLAYLLFQEEKEEIKEAAVQLIIGDTSIKELKSSSYFLSYIENAEKKLKTSELNKKDVYQFVEKHLYVF